MPCWLSASPCWRRRPRAPRRRTSSSDGRDHIEEALAVRGGVVLKAGGNRVIKALAGPSCRLIDLKGHTATPGLIDSHYHVIYYGMQFWPGFLDIRFPTVESKSDLRRVVGAKAKSLKPGKLADIVVWSRDLYTVRPAELRDLESVMTIVNGEVLYQAGK